MTHEFSSEEIQAARDNRDSAGLEGLSLEELEDIGYGGASVFDNRRNVAEKSKPKIKKDIGSGAIIATGSETKRARRNRRGPSMTPDAIRARERRARLRRENEKRMYEEADFGGPDLGGR